MINLCGCACVLHVRGLIHLGGCYRRDWGGACWAAEECQVPVVPSGKYSSAVTVALLVALCAKKRHPASVLTAATDGAWVLNWAQLNSSPYKKANEMKEAHRELQ